MDGRAGRLVGMAALALSLACALSGCQLGDYAASPDCDGVAEPFARWLTDQPLVTSATVVSAELNYGTDRCDLTFRVVIPDSTTKARFLPLGRAIKKHIPTDARSTVEVAHGESTEFVDIYTDLGDISW